MRALVLGGEIPPSCRTGGHVCRSLGDNAAFKFAVAAIFILFLIGCGADSGKVAAYGTVTYHGEPISNAAVIFIPIDGRPTTAPIDGSGQYSTELPSGNYTVIVNIGRDVPAGFKEGDPLPPPKIQLPPKYTIPARSELSATVSPDQSESIDFTLE